MTSPQISRVARPRGAPTPLRAALGALAALALAGSASAQFNFSVDWRGPSVARLDSGTFVPITEGDVLQAPQGAPGHGPLPPPEIRFTGGAIGISQYPSCVGHAAGDGCGVELDALSAGLEPPYQPAGPAPGPLGRRELWFSTDELAVGVAAALAPPNVFSEAPIGDSSADAMVDFASLPAPPLPPGAVATPAHTGALDGNGLASATGFVYAGIGLVEPNPPFSGPPPPPGPSPGDNLDALDIGSLGGGFPPLGLFYSLDSAFVDPAKLVPNSGSAALAGFSGADVVRVTAPGTAPILYAAAGLLGLDLAGTDLDDLDALVLAENGDGVYQPSTVPYDWVGGGTDMLLFSVRRGSDVIGKLDSIFGVPIEEGDILTTPLAMGAGGLSPFPGIFIAAENIGLATARTDGVTFGDDLNALDVTVAPCFDCNNNGVEDAVDIATGSSSDVDYNGVPDECEVIKTPRCFCDAPFAPCSNADAAAGCHHSLGYGAELDGTGSSSVTSDDLVLVATLAPALKTGMFLQGATTIQTPFRDGVLCVGNPTERLEFVSTDAGGMAKSTASIVTEGVVSAGQTRQYQYWFRDGMGPCGNGSNLTHGLEIVWTP